jgi:hypothetical protein
LTIGLPGLPDGIFSYQKSEFGDIGKGLEMENVGMFYGYLEYFTDMGIFSPFWNVVQRKIWQPCFDCSLSPSKDL